MIEVVLGYAVGAVVKKVSERWIDDLAEQVDEGSRELVREWLSALRRDDVDQASASARKLDDRMRADPGLVEQLATAPPPRQLTASPGIGEAEPDESPRSLIEYFEEFLAYEFALAAGLKRAVALPGFFNCTDCVTVIDARPERDGMTPPELDRGPSSDPSMSRHCGWKRNLRSKPRPRGPG